MSYHYSLVLVEDFSAQGCLDGDQCAELKSIRTAERSSFGGKKKASSRRSQSGTMPEPLMADHGVGRWMLSLRASPASPSQSPADKRENPMSVTSGLTPFALLEKSDPSTASWKTCQVSLLTNTLALFSETFPKAGILHDGKLYRLPSLERRISEIGSGLWPSPKALEVNETVEQWDTQRQIPKNKMMGPSLTVAVKMWPTPTTRDWKDGTVEACKNVPENALLGRAVHRRWPTPKEGDWRSGRQRRQFDTMLNVEVFKDEGLTVGGAKTQPKGQLNPMWVEWLMGWPLGWTALKPLETAKFRQWLEQHGSC